MNHLFYDKEQHAIDLLRVYQPKDHPYYGCFSGGKDSCVIKELANRAEVNVIWHYNVTTIDPPELVRFIKREHKDVVFDIPKENFWKVAERKGFPTRKTRWCCEVFKETKSPNASVLIMGVRAAESPSRAKHWKEFKIQYNDKTSFVVSPILNWLDFEVWQFIKGNNLPYCELYDQGFKRIGCVGCPMSSRKSIELDRWPHIDRLWRNLFHYVWNNRSGSLQRDGRIWFGDKYFNSADNMYEWWRSNDSLPRDNECQGILDMYS
jgi:phosphoadenosine phosphosulfate reductase